MKVIKTLRNYSKCGTFLLRYLFTFEVSCTIVHGILIDRLILVIFQQPEYFYADGEGICYAPTWQ